VGADLSRGYKIALYEPPPVGDHSSVAWLPRYEREMAQGRPGAALVTVAKGTDDDSPVIRMLPRAVLVPLMSLGMRAQARQADGEVTLNDLIPTVRQEARLVLAADLVSAATAVRAEVLLLGGGRSARPFKDALSALHTAIPHARRVELPRLGHLAADNGGKPELVAQRLRGFFL
jgi:hypothetical protein